MQALSRRQWLVGCCALIGWSSWQLGNAQAEDFNVASLRDQLRAVLKARRDLEFVFISHVADLVDEGKLPRDLVLAIMKYAVGKRPHTPYPWFEKAIRIKAEELGVDI